MLPLLESEVAQCGWTGERKVGANLPSTWYQVGLRYQNWVNQSLCTLASGAM